VKKGFTLFGGGPAPKNILAPVLPSFNLLMEKVDEASNVLKKYMDAFTPPELKPSRLNWSKFLDDLKLKYGSQASSKRLKVIWPSGKMPVDFVSDTALLTAALGVVIQNSLEALPVEGVIDMKMNFAGGTAEFLITDSGKGLKPGQAEMLFKPLFTTKESHYGLGLVNCRRIMRAFGGDAVHVPGEAGNTFKLTFRSIENAAAKK